MKRKGMMLAGLLVLVLTACGLKSGGEEKDITVMDAKETEEKEAGWITEEDLWHYYYSEGSSSLNRSIIIYKYHEEFIFAACYFECGDQFLETRLLSRDETTSFLDQINALPVKEEETKETEDREGAYSEKGDMVVDGISYPVGQMDFNALGIILKDIHEVEYPPEEEILKYELEGVSELQASTQWLDRPVFIGLEAFEKSVAEQLKEQLGEEIDTMAVEELSDEDLTIRIQLRDGEKLRATVTYMGYVADIEGE